MDILNVNVDIEPYKIFKKELLSQGRTYHWLASMMEFSYLHTYRLLNGKATFTMNHIQVLNGILGLDVSIEQKPSLHLPASLNE